MALFPRVLNSIKTTIEMANMSLLTVMIYCALSLLLAAAKASAWTNQKYLLTGLGDRALNMKHASRAAHLFWEWI